MDIPAVDEATIVHAKQEKGTFPQVWMGKYRTITYQWTVFGNTFPHKELLKKQGGEYNGMTKTWHFDVETLPAAVQAILDKPVDETHQETGAENQAEESEPDQPKPIEIPSVILPPWFVPPSWWSYLNIYIQHRPAIALVGPAGNGKTTAAEVALDAQGIGYLMLNCTDRTEVVDLVGGMMLRASGEEWVDGIVTRAFRAGKAVILDEADALDPRVMMSLQTALLDPGPDKTSRYITVNGEKVYPENKCPIIMTMNTVGSGRSRQYVGRNQLDSASLDRLTMIQTRYENETNILTARGIKQVTAKKIIQWAEKPRHKIDDAGLPLVLSPRTLLRVAECIEKFFWSFELAIELEFFSRIDPRDVELVR